MTILFECLKSLLAGFILGSVFLLIKLPLPAPIVLPGVFGILGITLSYLLLSKYL